jgi:hypothetical protein
MEATQNRRYRVPPLWPIYIGERRLNSWDLSVNHFSRFQDHYLKCCTIFSLGDARPKGLFFFFIGLGDKIKIWPLHIHSISSKTRFWCKELKKK